MTEIYDYPTCGRDCSRTSGRTFYIILGKNNSLTIAYFLRRRPAQRPGINCTGKESRAARKRELCSDVPHDVASRDKNAPPAGETTREREKVIGEKRQEQRSRFRREEIRHFPSERCRLALQHGVLSEIGLGSYVRVQTCD